MKILLSLIILISSSIAFSQTIDFENTDEIVNGLIAEDNNGWLSLNSYADVSNNTTDDLIVYSTYEILSTTVPDLDSMYYTYCWGQCYGPGVIESIVPNPMTPGLTIYADWANNTQGYKGYYYATQPGNTTVRQSFYDEDNVYVSHFDVLFCMSVSAEDFCAVSVQDISDSNGFLGTPYPNPSSDGNVKIDYSLNSGSNNSIHITNLLGEEVYVTSLEGNKGTLPIDLSDISNGVYIISLRSDNSVLKTERLVIE